MEKQINFKSISICEEVDVLLEWKMEVDDQLRILNADLTKIKSDSFQKRTFMDSDEYDKKVRQRGDLSGMSQRIQLRIKKLKDIKPMGHYFMEAAYKLLHIDDYKEIMALANALRDKAEKKPA